MTPLLTYLPGEFEIDFLQELMQGLICRNRSRDFSVIGLGGE